MATSAFKSATKRTPVGKSSSTTSADDGDSSSSNRRSSSGQRRYRSLSRFSHRVPDLDSAAEDTTPVTVRRGRFVNTVRGSGFPEISLDDLAVEFFDSFSAAGGGGGGGDGVGDRGRSGSRSVSSGGGGGGERRGRSVSRYASGAGRLDAETESSRRRRSVSKQVARGGGGGSNGGGGSGRVIDSESGRRRRSVSVVRCRITDSESDLDHFQSSSNRGNLKSSINGNSQITGSRKPAASDCKRGLRRTFSQNDLKYNDGYSSQSSAVTDDEGRDMSSSKHGIERIIRAVHSQKKGDHPTGDDVNGELYQAMRKELRHAVEEIRTEIEQASAKTKKPAGDGDVRNAISTIRNGHSTKLHQSEKRKQDLLAEILLEQQRGREELSMIVKELLVDQDNSAIAEKPARDRKRSSDRRRMSISLSDEAEKYIEDFISNIEDTDISSLDDERSETSSNFGIIKTEAFHSPPVPKSVPVEMDGVMLPWLKWETPADASTLPHNNALQQTPTSKSNLWEFDSIQETSIGHDASSHTTSSQASWSPCDSGVKSVEGRSFQIHPSSSTTRKLKIDVNDYLNRRSNEDFLYQAWNQRHRINSGGLHLCNHTFL